MRHSLPLPAQGVVGVVNIIRSDLRLSALVLTIAMVSYFAMAAGLGETMVPVAHHSAHSDVHVFRQVFYARAFVCSVTKCFADNRLRRLAADYPAPPRLTVVLGGTLALRHHPCRPR